MKFTSTFFTANKSIFKIYLKDTKTLHPTNNMFILLHICRKTCNKQLFETGKVHIG